MSGCLQEEAQGALDSRGAGVRTERISVPPDCCRAPAWGLWGPRREARGALGKKESEQAGWGHRAGPCGGLEETVFITAGGAPHRTSLFILDIGWCRDTAGLPRGGDVSAGPASG